MQIRNHFIWSWITTTPLQATALYAAMINGGKLITPSLIKKKKQAFNTIISNNTSVELRGILRKVVNSENGTASLADKNGYYVGGKTGTAESYGNKKIVLILLYQYFQVMSQITHYL